MRHHFIDTLFVLTLALLLAGCSSGPSQDEMKEALLPAFFGLVGKDAVFSQFEASNCTERNDVHTCRVKATLAYTSRFGGREEEREQDVVGTYNFVETDDGWKWMH